MKIKLLSIYNSWKIIFTLSILTFTQEIAFSIDYSAINVIIVIYLNIFAPYALHQVGV